MIVAIYFKSYYLEKISQQENPGKVNINKLDKVRSIEHSVKGWEENMRLKGPLGIILDKKKKVR
jgi:hypothetical protein